MMANFYFGFSFLLFGWFLFFESIFSLCVCVCVCVCNRVIEIMRIPHAIRGIHNAKNRITDDLPLVQSARTAYNSHNSFRDVIGCREQMKIKSNSNVTSTTQGVIDLRGR